MGRGRALKAGGAEDGAVSGSVKMGRGRALKTGGAEDGAASGSVKMGRGRALTSAEGAAAENAARERLRKNAP